MMTTVGDEGICAEFRQRREVIDLIVRAICEAG